jgi:hypothetical protein
MYPSARARKLAERRAAGAYIPRLNGIAGLFPFDLELPGLQAAASRDVMVPRLRREVPDQLGRILDCDVELVRYKAHKRAVLKYRLKGTPVRAVYGKLRKDGAASVVRAARAVARAGVRTPETLAWLPDLGMIVQAEGPGVRLGDLRGTDRYDRWMPAVAETVAQLHDRRDEDLPRVALAAEADELQDAANVIAGLLPHLGDPARSLARRLAASIVSLNGELSTTHGSFHDDQVLVDDDGVVLIDTDGASLGHPSSDVGHFLSYLSAAGADDAYGRFLDGYRSARGSAGCDYLLYEAASLLRWATLPFRELRTDWPEAVVERLLKAQRRLHEYVASAR